MIEAQSCLNLGTPYAHTCRYASYVHTSHTYIQTTKEKKEEKQSDNGTESTHLALGLEDMC